MIWALLHISMKRLFGAENPIKEQPFFIMSEMNAQYKMKEFGCVVKNVGQH